MSKRVRKKCYVSIVDIEAQTVLETDKETMKRYEGRRAGRIHGREEIRPLGIVGIKDLIRDDTTVGVRSNLAVDHILTIQRLTLILFGHNMVTRRRMMIRTMMMTDMTQIMTGIDVGNKGAADQDAEGTLHRMTMETARMMTNDGLRMEVHRIIL